MGLGLDGIGRRGKRGGCSEGGRIGDFAPCCRLGLEEGL